MTPPTCAQVASKAALRGLALVALCISFGLAHTVMTPFQRKFFCDDQSIRYPRGECTVPYALLAPLGVLLGWATVAAVEFARIRADGVLSTGTCCYGNVHVQTAGANRCRSRDPRHLQSLLVFARRVFSSEFRARYFSQVLHGAYFFCLGLAACDLLMGFSKNLFGRHRPFFLTVCQPRLPGGVCNASVAYDVSICQPSVPAREFLDAQRSFPSGHASFSIYCAVFVVLHLHRRGRGGIMQAVWRLAVQFMTAAAGLYVASSRVADDKHHWSDVLAGGILGACMAWAAVSAIPAAAGEVKLDGSPGLTGLRFVTWYLAVKPFRRMFFCDDESIKYPLHEGTLPFSACIATAIPLGLIVVIGSELVRHCCCPEKGKSGDRNARPTLQLVVGGLLPEKLVPPAAAVIAGLYQLVLTGLLNEMFTVVGKMGFGRHRPHFLAVCQFNASACELGKAYTIDICRPTSASDFKNAQMSFPSGHSSFSMAISVYLALYMQARLGFRHPAQSLKNFLQAVLVLAGACVAMSRVSDYKHHWSDILAGGIIGTLIALLVASKFFERGARRKDYQAAFTTDSDTHGHATTGSVGMGNSQTHIA